MNRYAITLGAAAATIGAFGNDVANATVIVRQVNNQGIGAMCQGALPNFEGAFRKRPLAIKNEGSTGAFLTCGLTSQYDASTGGVPTVELLVVNRNAAAANISCTLVDGYVDPTIGFADYFPLTINVGGMTFGALEWDASGGGGTFDPIYAFPALSCNVPANFEINRQSNAYSEEIGA